MLAIIQRVRKAEVVVDNKQVAKIDQGILAFIGYQKSELNDNLAEKNKKMLEKIISYRIFEDEAQKMNLSLLDINAELLLVPQFTLAADTSKGRRPSFDSAMPPQNAELAFQNLRGIAQQTYAKTQFGIFGADMQISLINSGPVTFSFEI
ncbi:MAG: D-tyrosyl-tRNA(Tyr) deacylase [Cardiobacteriaceae bacterium]|nr:D-tyrosyl-tRNA(Tyr) deacylase [Cardiobacteriaceae bacterium]